MSEKHNKNSSGEASEGQAEAKTDKAAPVNAEEATPAAEEKAAEEVKAPDPIEELKKQLADKCALAEDYKRKWYSVSAEYDNYRKRTQTATSAAYQDGKAEAILKLLPVADTFGYAYDGASDEKTRAGIDKIIKNFNNILLSLGVEEVPINAGDNFDEGSMEAVMNVPCEGEEKPNTVKAILKKGYRREGKVIRFAQVSVTV